MKNERLCIAMAAAAVCAAGCREPLKCQAPGKACGELCCAAPEHGAATCDGAVCGFSCEAGFHSAGGACTSDSAPTSCGPSAVDCTAGLPAHAGATCDGTSCGFACDAGYHRTGSSCTADTTVTSCGPLGQDCTASLPGEADAVCEGDPPACGFHCHAGYHQTGTDCTSDGTITSCGPAGVDCTLGLTAHAAATCDGFGCGLDCNPSYHLAAGGGACDADTSVSSCGTAASDCNTEKPANSVATCNGTSCGFACLATFHSCDGISCASNLSTATCGIAGCSPCTAPPNGHATCNGTNCGFDCDSDFHKNLIGTACDADTSVASCGAAARDCNTEERPANSNARCSGVPLACGFACAAGYCSSGQSCVSNQTDSLNCGSCGHACSDWEQCNAGSCVTSGSSCLSIKNATSTTADGLYWIDPDGAGSNPPFQAYCDMSSDSGGWTLVARIDASSSGHFDTAAVGALTSPTQGQAAKLADAVINALRGPSLGAGLIRFRCGSETAYFQEDKFFIATGVESAAIGRCSSSRTPFGPWSTATPYFNHYGLNTYPLGAACGNVLYFANVGPGCYQAGNGHEGVVYVRATAPSYPSNMPDSPTVHCTTSPCPSFGEADYGQDGNYSLSNPTYTILDNDTSANTDDDVVRDSVTGLLWQRNASSAADWATAKSNCASLVQGAYDDWRLPTRLELLTIVDYGRPTPVIDTTTFTADLPNAVFWTSTAKINGEAWTIHFGDGDISGAAGTRARCVRGPAFSGPGPYVTTTNTVLDSARGLMWHKAASASTGSWTEALATCESSTVGGHGDWRLPSMKELATVVDEGRVNPAIDPTAFPSTTGFCYWTSTQRIQSGHIFHIEFDGAGVTAWGNPGSLCYYRCVR